MRRRLAAIAAAAVIAMSAAACAGATASPSATFADDAESVFRRYVEAINAGDATRAASLIASDATVYGTSASAVGVDAIVAAAVCTAEIVSVEGNGSTVTVALNFTGKSALAPTGDCGVGPGGRHIVTVREGKIVSLAEAP